MRGFGGIGASAKTLAGSGERQREQMLARTQAREAVIAQVRLVSREELATSEWRRANGGSLRRRWTREDRAAVLERVEADRREQIGRAQAAAERRVERRQSLSGRVGKS